VLATAEARFARDTLTPIPPCMMGGHISKFPILRVGMWSKCIKSLTNQQDKRNLALLRQGSIKQSFPFKK